MSLSDLHISSASSHRPNPLPSPLTSAVIANALEHSSDAGITLFLSKLAISDVGVDAAEELATIGRTGPEDESVIERLTLGSNCLTTLPTEFALLSRLRYLNLKHNNFSTFPDVLTLMPSLDTLDISHNKIKRLPSQPGQLTNLRVFSFSRNKITKLPPYFSQFRKLQMLRLERNPIEWPPRNVLELQINQDSEQVMKDWIHKIQMWIEHNTISSHFHDDSGFSESLEWENNLKQEKHKAWRFPIREYDSDAAVAPHGRSFSVDSNISSSSIQNSFHESGIPLDSSHLDLRVDELHVRIPRQSNSFDGSPVLLFGGYLPSPADSDKFDTASSGNNSDLNLASPTQHLRASSFAGGLRNTLPSKVTEKKSLPDLRSVRWDQKAESSKLSVETSALSLPLSDYDTDCGLHASFIQHPDQPSSSIQSTFKTLPQSGSQTPPSRHMPPLPSVTFECNSYFHRLSSISVSVQLPQPLHFLAEAGRSILFATSQIYQTIEHYANNAIDEQDSSVFKKVLEPAHSDMVHLIRSLDRFDSSTQRTIPPPPICLDLVESCRNTVAVSGKAVNMFALQLRIAPCEDFRYSRWILLELYAATAEISLAWQALLPHSRHLSTFLQTKPTPTGVSTPIDQGSENSIQPEFAFSLPRLRTIDASSGFATIGRTHTARRHAGSFSSKDVEIGKQLPSYDIVPNLSGGVATQTPTLRTPKRQATAPPSASSFSGSSPFPASPWHLSSTPPSYLIAEESGSQSHSLHNSQECTPASSSTSPSFASKSTFLQLPNSSKRKVDKEALHTILQAVETAPLVWDATEEALTETMLTDSDIICKAREATKKLTDNLQILADNDRAPDAQLSEDAHLFLKTVVQVSNLVKISGLPRSTSIALRSQMLKLNNLTEEFAKLLHLPSFSSQPYSPNFSGSSSSVLSSAEDNRLPSSLSRTRSAQPAPTPKLPLSSPFDGPRSALPTTSSFKIPSFIRLQSIRDPRTDIPDPG